MNIFKSKEIYKKIPRSSYNPDNNQTPLRVVRGVYVSGERKDPYFIDHGISINSIGSNHCKVREYVSRYDEVRTEGSYRFIGFRKAQSSTIEQYTRRSVEINKKDGAYRFIGFRRAQDTTIYTYEKKYVETHKKNGAYNFIGFNKANDSTIYTFKPPMKLKIEPSHLLTVTGYGCSQKISVTNID